MHRYMFLYFLLYLIISVSLVTIGLIVNKKYIKNGSGKYFLIFSLLTAIWCMLYFFSYTTTDNKEVLLYISRLLYSLTIPAFYSIIIFFFLFNHNNKIKIIKNEILITLIFITIICLSVFSPYVIEDMIQNPDTLVYHEKFGKLYFIYLILYLMVLPIFIIFSWFKVKILSTINKIRFKIMGVGFLIFLTISLIFLVILPSLGVFILQKEIVIFFIPFILLTRYSIYRYFFINMKIGVSIILLFLLSLITSICSTFIVYEVFFYYISNLNNSILLFWEQTNGINKLDLLVYLLINITFFEIIFYYLKRKLIGEKGDYNRSLEISKLKKEISFISNFVDLNRFLKNKINHIFKIKYTEIILFSNQNSFDEIKKYFKKEKINDIFINDIVFIEENKNKFNQEKIEQEINKKSYLIFPLYNNKLELIGIFNLGKKPFNDAFNTEEITAFKDLIEFITGHLKYLRIYDRINDLNINLDKMIDNKTMQFNTLINKQKDFIALISHEIKGPVGSSIFQVDCLLDDIKDGNYTEKYIKKEIGLLNQQLLKIGDLTNRLFSIEKYDIGKIILLKEKININDLILYEIDNLQRNNPNIDFITNIDNNIGFLELDKVQITQVFDNLLNNAIKFSLKNNSKPQIIITTILKGENVFIEVEDNGHEFKHTNISGLFEKYTTGKGSSIGLGMGLYLCKKIIELHNGEIFAINSEKLGGAKFIIKLEK